MTRVALMGLRVGFEKFEYTDDSRYENYTAPVRRKSYLTKHAEVAKLVDAPRLGRGPRKGLEVQVLSSAQ